MIAIDFGTSNSSLALIKESEEAPRVQLLEYGDSESYAPMVIPSVVCTCKNAECKKAPLTFGHQASRHYFQDKHDSSLLSEMKLFFDKSTIEPPLLVETLKTVMLREPDGFLTPIRKVYRQPHWDGEVPLGPAQFVPGTEALIREMLQRGKVDYRDRDLVAVGVPASFGAVGMRRLRNAVKTGVLGGEAGFDRIHLYHEPLAAARSYLDIQAGTFLVLDYGGGTLDITVMPVDEAGKSKFSGAFFSGFPEGGSRIDDAILTVCLAKGGESLQQWYETQPFLTKLRIKRNVELGKIALSTAKDAFIEFPGSGVDPVRLTRSDASYAMQSIMTRMVAKVTETIVRKLDRLENIDFVVLSGGTSLSPVVQDSIQAMFQHIPHDRFIVPDPGNPDDVEKCLCAVVRGLALLMKDGHPSIPVPDKEQSGLTSQAVV
jgi:molecular chaperone DnaK (HSP70)